MSTPMLLPLLYPQRFKHIFRGCYIIKHRVDVCHCFLGQRHTRDTLDCLLPLSIQGQLGDTANTSRVT